MSLNVAEFDTVIYSVYSTFNCIPKPQQMFLDDLDYYGLFYWYNGCKEIDEQIKKQTENKKGS